LDGNIMDEPLANMGLNRGWLKSRLESQGISLDNVFIAQIDTVGDLYIDAFNDAMRIPTPKVKELLYTNLEKVYVDLLCYTQDTLDAEAKAMYMKNVQKVQGLKEKLKPYLIH